MSPRSKPTHVSQLVPGQNRILFAICEVWLPKFPRNDYGRISGLETGRSTAHIDWMVKARSRLLEVKITALMPTRWEWQVCEKDTPIMSGFAASRETAQIDGDSALFLLLRSSI
jgi:hypothetical protein